MDKLFDTSLDVLSIPVSQARSREDFIACLDRARVLAGPLSHREIETRSGRRLRRTKIGQVLAGELPRRDFLVTYLEVCDIPEADRAEWLLAWARLVTGRAAPGPTPPPSTVDITVAAETTQVLAQPAMIPVIAPEVRQLRAKLDEALHALRRSEYENRELERRLAMTESAHAEATTQARTLRDQLDRAQNKINDLTEVVDWLRAEGPGTEKQAPATEDVPPPSPYHTPGPARESKYALAYTRGETEDIFGSNGKAARPVIGL